MSESGSIILILNDIYLLIEEYINKNRVSETTRLNAIQLEIQITATRIVFDNPDRASVLIRNVGGSDIYIGGNDGVTASNGMLLRADDVLILDKTKGEIWGISDSVAGTIAYIEE